VNRPQGSGAWLRKVGGGWARVGFVYITCRHGQEVAVADAGQCCPPSWKEKLTDTICSSLCIPDNRITIHAGQLPSTFDHLSVDEQPPDRGAAIGDSAAPDEYFSGVADRSLSNVAWYVAA